MIHLYLNVSLLVHQVNLGTLLLLTSTHQRLISWLKRFVVWSDLIIAWLVLMHLTHNLLVSLWRHTHRWLVITANHTLWWAGIHSLRVWSHLLTVRSHLLHSTSMCAMHDWCTELHRLYWCIWLLVVHSSVFVIGVDRLGLLLVFRMVSVLTLLL